jgi:hypothetical protein
MAIDKFPNTATGKAAAEATPQPRVILEGARITVLTGEDMPPAEAVVDPRSIVLTTLQLLRGADAIGRARCQAIQTYIRGVVGIDAKDPADQIAPTGNFSQRLYWGYHNATIRRTDANINALRVAIQGAMTNAQSIAEMDAIFVAGSGMDP